MLNADSDVKTFLAVTNSTDGHAIEDITKLVPLVQSTEDELDYITTRLNSF
jgi:hypothetical protein